MEKEEVMLEDEDEDEEEEEAEEDEASDSKVISDEGKKRWKFE